MIEHDIKEILELSDEVEQRADLVFSYQSAIEALFRKLTDESAKNIRETRQLWNSIYSELKEIYGIDMDAMIVESISYNHRIGKFVISKKLMNDYREVNNG